jgi:hypothetical protein
MASTTFNKILLTVNGERRPIFEAEADEALTPGELVRFDTDDELEPHGTAGGYAAPMFVVENPFVEIDNGANIDKDYALGDYARYIWAQAGDLIYAFLADGQTVAKGAPLKSDGAGALTAYAGQAVAESGSATYTVYDGAIVAYADEDKAASGARARIKVRAA